MAAKPNAPQPDRLSLVFLQQLNALGRQSIDWPFLSEGRADGRIRLDTVISAHYGKETLEAAVISSGSFLPKAPVPYAGNAGRTSPEAIPDSTGRQKNWLPHAVVLPLTARLLLRAHG